MDSKLTTYSGEKLDFENLDPESIRVEDIAHGLSLTCRFGGQIDRFYSVALHSILVSRDLEERGKSRRLQLYGLFHDAAEAYTGDIPAPMKQNLDEYERLEDRILEVIWKSLNLEPPTEEEWKQVKKSDERLLNQEGLEMLSHAEWPEDKGVDFSLESSPGRDEEKFGQRFRELTD